MSNSDKYAVEKSMIEMDPDRPVSQAAYARYVGISRQGISNQVSNGLIVLNEHGKVIPRQADLARQLSVKGSAGSKGSTGDEVNEVHELKLREQRAKTEMAEFKVAELKGQYVSREEVDDFYFRIVRNARNGFSNLHKTLTPQLKHMKDDHAISELLRKAVNDILGELDRALKAGE